MSSPARPRVWLLVADIDNTLYDWVGIWFASFDAMLRKASEMSGVPRGTLEDEARAVHRRYGTPEYSHLLQELPSLSQLPPGRPETDEVVDASVNAFRRARSAVMELYPGVLESLRRIQASGCRIVGYTETSAFYTALRLRWLDLDGILDTVYSPPDHDFPEGVSREMLRQRPDDDYPLKRTEHHFTPAGHYKPDTSVLRAILDEFAVQPSEVLYVGDSLAKDIAMAQQVGVHDAHAAYGVAQSRAEYELLRRVSHWTDEDIERERQLLASPPVVPTVTLDRFTDVFDHFNFGNDRQRLPHLG